MQCTNSQQKHKSIYIEDSSDKAILNFVIFYCITAILATNAVLDLNILNIHFSAFPRRTGPEVIKLFFSLNSTEHEILTASKKLKYRQTKFLALSLSGVFIMLINVKMPTVVGILTFTSRIKFRAQLSLA